MSRLLNRFGGAVTLAALFLLVGLNAQAEELDPLEAEAAAALLENDGTKKPKPEVSYADLPRSRRKAITG